MIKPEQVPDEVVETAAVVLMGRLMVSRADALLVWSGMYEHEKEQFRREARAAFVAGLEAWPNSELVPWYHADETLILPLPTEASDRLRPDRLTNVAERLFGDDQ